MMKTTMPASAPHLFFSIIVPAHNEEAYIQETLEHLVAMDYPPTRSEVIVVENASTDRTYARAKSFEGAHVRVLTIPGKGVSSAKNFSVAQVSPESEWVIFLDADTLLKKDFLSELNTFLYAHRAKNYTIGTTEVIPLSDTMAAKFWFSFYNWGHKLTKTSFALQIIDARLLSHINFAVHLTMGEDLKLITDARRHGAFFYFPTKNVFTSVRRFAQEGWIKVFLHWNFVALLPAGIQKFFHYKVVR